jgi:hypothetical protein
MERRDIAPMSVKKISIEYPESRMALCRRCLTAIEKASASVAVSSSGLLPREAAAEGHSEQAKNPIAGSGCIRWGTYLLRQIIKAEVEG